MTKVEVCRHLCFDVFEDGIAEVICDIAVNGEVVYPNESILVIVYNREEYPVIDDEIDHAKHWTVCDSIDDFMDGIVYGAEDARENYCKHYVSDFKEVKKFVSDF